MHPHNCSSLYLINVGNKKGAIVKNANYKPEQIHTPFLRQHEFYWYNEHGTQRRQVLPGVLTLSVQAFNDELFIHAVFAGRGGLSCRSRKPGQHSCFCSSPQPPTRNAREAQREWRVA